MPRYLKKNYVLQEEMMRHFNYAQVQLDTDYKEYVKDNPNARKRDFLWNKFDNLMRIEFLQNDKKVQDLVSKIPVNERKKTIDDLKKKRMFFNVIMHRYDDRYLSDYQENLVKKANMKGFNLNNITAEERIF